MLHMSTEISSSSRIVAPSPLTSQRQMRDLNSSVILDLLWDAPIDTGLTASELVEKTNITRATVLSICGELREQGWVTEDRAPTEVPGRGRQARRFTFNRQKHLVAAADVGFRSVTAVIADLKGTILGRAQRLTLDDPFQQDRTQLLLETFNEALHQASTPREQVNSACIGVAAPVTHDGTPYPSDPPNPFWENMHIDQSRLHNFCPLWSSHIENDANLAAIAEQHARESEYDGTMVTLLAGVRMGSGIIINGGLFKGFHGGAGELGYLDYFSRTNMVPGLSTGSLGPLGTASTLISQQKHDSTLQETHEDDPEQSDFDHVLAAAAQGDLLAMEILMKIRGQLTATILTLGHLVDPELVIISGGAAQKAASLVPGIASELAKTMPFPPTIKVSNLGRDVVVVGAIHNAIQQVRRNIFPG